MSNTSYNPQTRNRLTPRGRWHLAPSALLTWCLLASSCSLSEADSFRVDVEERHGLAFPTFVGEGGPLSLLKGTLIELDGCLWIATAAMRYVVVWPSQFTLVDLNGPIVTDQDQDFRPGVRVSTGGGAYDVSSFSVTGAEALSAECASGGWWLATNPTVVVDP